MITRTKAAKRWLDTMGRIYTWRLLGPIVERAEEVRARRGAPQLGKVHLELALEELALEELTEDGR